MKKLFFVILAFCFTSCINTIGWDKFSSRRLAGDFYLTSMNDRNHLVVLSTDGSESNGIIVIPEMLLEIGNNEHFILAKRCRDENELIRSDIDTSYYIIDIREFEHKNWFRRTILSDNNYKYETHIYTDKNNFLKALDSLQIKNVIELKSVTEDVD